MWYGFWSDSCHHCGCNYFENSKEVCTWNILTAFCHKILPFIPSPLFGESVYLCGRELWGRHFHPLFSCCNLFRITGMFLQRLHEDNVVPLDMSGEVTKREAVTSWGMFDQPLFCKVAVCVLLAPAAGSQGNLYS